VPVAVLFVEGELDALVLAPLMPTGVTIENAGGKGAIRAKTGDRRKSGATAAYLRDRDFDFDPPTQRSAPTIDKEVKGDVHGWRWCRHEMESYLLEPSLVERATGWPAAEFSQRLVAAGLQIAGYTAARWAVGTARRELPPFRDLATRPELSNEFKLPDDCSEAASLTWAQTHVAEFRTAAVKSLEASAVEATIAKHLPTLKGLATVEDVLHWHSGKDLLAALAPNLPSKLRDNPKLLVRQVQDWVRSNPAQALGLLPEWAALMQSLAA
jgi:hypothetical protein